MGYKTTVTKNLSVKSKISKISFQLLMFEVPINLFLVQVVKEPISTKDQISAELSLAGRFIVLVPFF
jgi:hypothetical protein